MYVPFGEIVWVDDTLNKEGGLRVGQDTSLSFF